MFVDAAGLLHNRLVSHAWSFNMMNKYENNTRNDHLFTPYNKPCQIIPLMHWSINILWRSIDRFDTRNIHTYCALFINHKIDKLKTSGLFKIMSTISYINGDNHESNEK